MIALIFSGRLFCKKSFNKEKRSTFFFVKKKKVAKKKLTTLQVDGLSSMEALSTKARSLFANAHLKCTVCSAKGISPFTVLCRHEVRMVALRFARGA